MIAAGLIGLISSCSSDEQSTAATSTTASPPELLHDIIGYDGACGYRRWVLDYEDRQWVDDEPSPEDWGDRQRSGEVTRVGADHLTYRDAEDGTEVRFVPRGGETTCS
jgi:hypothetical protein